MSDKKLKRNLKKLKKNGINVYVKERSTTQHHLALGYNNSIALTTSNIILESNKPSKPLDLIIFNDDLPFEIYDKVESKLNELLYYKQEVKKFKQFNIKKEIQNIINEVYK